MKKNEKTTLKHETTISCNETDLAAVLYDTIMAAVWEENNSKE